MRNLFRTSLHIGIDEREITLVDERESSSHASVLSARWNALDNDAAHVCQQQLSQLFLDAKLRRGRVRVVIADSLVRYFSVTPPANAIGLIDCEVAAALRFEELFDDSPARWQIQADWHLEHPFLACAIPDWLNTSVSVAISACGLRQVNMLPQFACVWNQYRQRLAPDSWLVVAHGAHLTLGIAAKRHLLTVRRLQSIAALDEGLVRLPGLLRRESLALGKTEPGQVFLFALPASSHREQKGVVLLELPPPPSQAQPWSAGTVLALTGSKK